MVACQLAKTSHDMYVCRGLRERNWSMPWLHVACVFSRLLPRSHTTKSSGGAAVESKDFLWQVPVHSLSLFSLSFYEIKNLPPPVRTRPYPPSPQNLASARGYM